VTEPPPFSPVLALLVTARHWESALTAALAELDLTPRTYALLGHVKSSPGISFSELARRSRTSVQNVHVAVKTLTERGLVHDDTAHAGTASTLRISKAGQQVLTRAHRRRGAIDDRVREAMPDVVAGLERVVAEMPARPPGG
jgi:DNA-binding MarR family transcriptional regulator